MPDYLDNPAGRLLVVLRDIGNAREARLQYRYRRREVSPAPEAPPEPTVGEILAIASDDEEPLQVALRMLEVRRLVTDTRSAVENLPEEEDPEFLLRHFGSVEKHVNRMVENVMSGAARIKPSDPILEIATTGTSPDAEVLYSLEACSRALHRWQKEASINPKQLQELIDQVRELVDSVAQTDALGVDEKSFLVQRLREVETALLGSRIIGYANLEAALDRLTGALVRRPDIREPSLLAKIGKFFQSLVSAAQGTSAIAGATTSTIEAINAIASSGKP